MLKTQRARFEMLLRVKDFGIANGELFPETSIGGQAFAEVAHTVAHIEALAQTKPVAAGTSKKVAREAVKAAMRKIARTGRGIERAPGTANPLRMPVRESDTTVLNAARAFIRNAEAVKDELVQLGLSPTCITDLRTAVDAFESAVSGRRAERSDVAKAHGSLKTVFAQASKALRKLDIVVPNVTNGDAGLLAAWNRSREVVRAGRRKPKAPTPVSADPAATPVKDPRIDLLRRVS
jgi:hypothetical protein